MTVLLLIFLLLFILFLIVIFLLILLLFKICHGHSLIEVTPMRRLYVGAAILLLLPNYVVAQAAPEDLLSAGNQVYFRWDGIEKHRDAYAKTATGKIVQVEMGPFLASVQ